MYKPIPDVPPKGNFLKKTPFTPAEERFFRVLQEAVTDSYYLFPKVTLYEILQNTKPQEWHYLGAKSIDFMIYDKTFEPKCGIELTDCYHDNKITRERDLLKKFLLAKADIPCIHISVEDNYKARELRNIILNAKVEPIDYPKLADVIVEMVSIGHGDD